MSKFIDIEQYRPKPHPYKALFKKHGICNATLANYLGVHPAYITNIMAGHNRMSKPIQEKLEPLVQQLQQEDRK